MILFDIVMTLIEDLVMSYFIADILKLPKKKEYICVCTTLCFIETMFFNNVLKNNVLLIIIMIVTFSGEIIVQNRKINLYHIIVSSIVIGLLILSNIITFVIVSAIYDIKVIEISQGVMTVIIVSILSRFVFLFICMTFRYLERKLNIEVNFNIEEWWIYGIFCLLIIITITTLGEAIFYNNISLKLIYIITIEFILMSISFLILYFKMKNNYKHNLELTNELLKSRYANDVYSKTNKLYYQIERDKHEMIYLLLKVRGLIDQGKANEATEFINNKINTYSKYDKISVTNNPMLDYSFSNIVSELKKHDYNIKVVSNIEEYNKILENSEVIEALNEYICLFAGYARKSKKMDIFLTQNNSYIIFKIIIAVTDEIIDCQYIKQSSYIKKKEINRKDNQIELKVLLKE